MSHIARAALAAAALACAPFSHAAPVLSTIQDTLYKADGTRFNGIVTVTWNSFLTGDQAPIGAQGATIQVVNGELRVQLAPTTTATPGTNYSVVYSSQGKFQFGETWAVPPSTSVLRIRDVRVSTGAVIGPPPVVTGVAITDVTGLVNELAARPVKGPAFFRLLTAMEAPGRVRRRHLRFCVLPWGRGPDRRPRLYSGHA